MIGGRRGFRSTNATRPPTSDTSTPTAGADGRTGGDAPGRGLIHPPSARRWLGHGRRLRSHQASLRIGKSRGHRLVSDRALVRACDSTGRPAGTDAGWAGVRSGGSQAEERTVRQTTAHAVVRRSAPTRTGRVRSYRTRPPRPPKGHSRAPGVVVNDEPRSHNVNPLSRLTTTLADEECPHHQQSDEVRSRVRIFVTPHPGLRGLARDEEQSARNTTASRCAGSEVYATTSTKRSSANRSGGWNSSHVFRRDGKRRSTWYAKYRLPDGRQVQRRIRPAWTERGRPPARHYTKRTAEAELRAVLRRGAPWDPAGPRTDGSDVRRRRGRIPALRRARPVDQAVDAHRLPLDRLGPSRAGLRRDAR